MEHKTLVVRSMKPEDLNEVCRIERESFSQPWSEKGFLDSMNQKNTCYLTALQDGRVAGYCGMLQVMEEADITNVAVDASFRGRGIGFAMLQELMRIGKEHGVEAFTLEVRQSNLTAISLYGRLGFENCGIRKNFYEKPTEHAVIMWKR